MKRYATLPKFISHETIDGETIVINLDKGHYYSLQYTASQLWNQLAGGADLDFLAEAYGSANQTRYQEINQFFQELEDEGLIAVHTSQDTPLTTLELSQESYQTPTLQKYTDMEDLLLLDPIHDTSDQGWPHRIMQ